MFTKVSTQGQLAVFYIIFYCASFHLSKSMITLVLSKNDLWFLKID